MSSPPTVSQETFKSLLGKLVKTPEYYTADDLKLALECIFTPDVVPPVQIGSFLTALHIERVERRPDFLAAAANVLRKRALKAAVEGIDEDFVVDIVGTGGDGHNTFNVSTTAAIVAAGAGARVVKHGSRASTSSSGSADLLQSLGCYFTPPTVDTPLPIARVPFTFIMAPQYHPTLAMIAPFRKALPHRTMFNVLGPLINPARPRGMVLGVAERELGSTFAHSLEEGGVQRAFVVCGAEGLDEISCAGDTHVWELNNGAVTERTVHPQDFGLQSHPLSAVAGGTPEENAETFKALLCSGSNIPERLTPVLDFVLMNAAALLVVAGVAQDLKDGVAKARESITSGKAWNALEQFRDAGLAAAAKAQTEAKSALQVDGPCSTVWRGVFGAFRVSDPLVSIEAAAPVLQDYRSIRPTDNARKLTRSNLNGHNGTAAPRRTPLVRPYTDTLSTANTEPGFLPDADPTEGLAAQPLQVIEVDQDVDGRTPVKLENFKCIGSYNWVDAPQPTIMVPGSPPVWRERPLPFRVPYDSGLQVFDPNGYYMGSASTLIPLFRAVDVVAEENADTTMDWSAVDFVVDRSSLRKLLRWARRADSETNTDPQQSAEGSKSDAHDFRLDLQLAGKKTVLVERWDTRTYQIAQPPKFGCRNNFDDAATSPASGCEMSKYHNRIVQYDLEGMRLVMRFEADACIPQEGDLLDAFARLTVTSSSSSSHPPLPPATVDSDTAIAVLRGGSLTPHSSLIEIATRSPKALTTHRWYETYTQLFLSQAQHFYVAVHQSGLFSEVAKHQLAVPRLARYAQDEHMQRSLRQLVRVLGAVQALVKAHGQRGRLSVVCRGGRLELFERLSAARLSDDELARFRN
ncbi:glycosyl transferase family, a/b domain-containing protein [Cubamyces menziesii]|nr:glycosyl transferase family, a/b domain-containing protein [Cubamyces menziesii]